MRSSGTCRDETAGKLVAKMEIIEFMAPLNA